MAEGHLQTEAVGEGHAWEKRPVQASEGDSDLDGRIRSSPFLTEEEWERVLSRQIKIKRSGAGVGTGAGTGGILSRTQRDLGPSRPSGKQ